MVRRCVSLSTPLNCFPYLMRSTSGAPISRRLLIWKSIKHSVTKVKPQEAVYAHDTDNKQYMPTIQNVICSGSKKGVSKSTPERKVNATTETKVKVRSKRDYPCIPICIMAPTQLQCRISYHILPLQVASAIRHRISVVAGASTVYGPYELQAYIQEDQLPREARSLYDRCLGETVVTLCYHIRVTRGCV